MTRGAPHSEGHAYENECHNCGMMIPQGREIPEIQNGREDSSDIQPYQYASMKAKPYNW